MMTATIIILLAISPWSIAALAGRNLEHRYTGQQSESKVKQPENVWRPARYRGLTIGKSTRADMLRSLGKPVRTELFSEVPSRPEVWYHYRSKDIPGTIVVNVDKKSKVILRLLLYPEDLSRDEAIKRFDNGFITTRYEFCEGFEDAESAPLYENPAGQFSYVEYRDKGIAISFDDHDKVSNITYVSRPIGIPALKCKQRAGARVKPS